MTNTNTKKVICSNCKKSPADLDPDQQEGMYYTTSYNAGEPICVVCWKKEVAWEAENDM